ncbi:unnamed protein product [Caenorhabditis sp. 36 PRJEB53466]|nr:unnamed protein product [Caenorhabditis sp. 36 PRJEB53466]
MVMKRGTERKKNAGKNKSQNRLPKPKLVNLPVLAAPKAPSPHALHAPTNAPQITAVLPAAPPTSSAPGPSKAPSPITPKIVAKEIREPVQMKAKRTVAQTVPVVADREIAPKPGPATVRKKRKSSSSNSTDKTSAENDSKQAGPIGKAPPSHTSSETDGSKEPSETDSNKRMSKFNKDLAQKFFKEMIESQKAKKKRKTSDERERTMDTMPEGSQINMSARALKKKKKKEAKKEPSTTSEVNYFKPNGEPVWMVAELAPGEGEKDEDGVVISNPELVNALAEDDLELEEKDWIRLSDAYMQCAMTAGKRLPEDYQFDPFGPLESIEKTSEYVSQETVGYLTIRNLVELSEEALKRFMNRNQGEDRNRQLGSRTPSTTDSVETGTLETPAVLNTEKSEAQLKTGLSTQTVTFDVRNVIYLSYDRQNPLKSAQKLREKTDSTEKTTQEITKEK